MDGEGDGPFIDQEGQLTSRVDHRGDMRPPFDTPHMRHLIPIVREIIAEIRRRFCTDGNRIRQLEDVGTRPCIVRNHESLVHPPVEVHDLIFRIPTVHPLIAVLKHVLTVMENEEEQAEDSDEEAPPFIRWNTRHLPIVDVSPDHPLLPTAHEIIELFHGRLYDEEDDSDGFHDDEDDNANHRNYNEHYGNRLVENAGAGAEADMEAN